MSGSESGDQVDEDWQTIPLSGFDPEGEPNIRLMLDGTMYVVFEYMPPMWIPDEEWPEGSFAGTFDDFDKEMERAIGVPVLWEDREFFLIQHPKPDTVDRIREFVDGYRDRRARS